MRRPWIRQPLTTSFSRPARAPAERSLGAVVILIVAVIAVMGIIAVVTFLLAVEGREQTLVPAVEGLELLDALPELQDRGLQYVVLPKFDLEVPKNVVVAQRPVAGSVVKQGRVVELSVSKGAILEKVPNYLDWTLDAAEQSIRGIYASSYKPLLRIANPSYIYAAKPEGTIIDQQPAAGTPISGVTELHFVVSLGQAGRTVTVGDYVGSDYRDAIGELAEKNLAFVFTVDTARQGADGEVVAQSPKAGSQVAPDAPVQLWMKSPTYDKDEELFDVLEYEVPKLVVRVPIRVELITRDATSVLLDMSYHPGGLLTLPYVTPKSGEIVVWIDDREVARAPADRERR